MCPASAPPFVRPSPGSGRIGVSDCPGRRAPDDRGRSLEAGLDADLDALAAWGATAVVSLMSPAELAAPGVAALGAGVEARNMDWLALPVADSGLPDAPFETAWATAGEGLRARLRDGADILVHGLVTADRPATLAARLMVELGTAPGQAIAAIGAAVGSAMGAARPDAILGAAQIAHVAGTAPAEEPSPDRGSDARRDRAIGTLLGLAVGDAVGTTLEFERRDDRAPRLTDMVGGGPFGLKPGEWTDDTAMALALAESLRARPTLDERDLMNRFVNWYRHGAHSCTGTCFDIGNTVRGALERFSRDGNPIAGETHAHAAGNGSLMRLAPVAVRHWHDAQSRRDVAARQSRTTHGAAEAVDACVLYADLLAEAIAGMPRSAVMRPRSEPYAGRIGPIAGGGWRGKPRAQVRGSGYVADALEAALWCVGRTADFRGAVLMAANLREDADTTAAIAGQLAGALYGAAGIPPAWRAAVAWRETIEALAAGLFEAGEAESGAEKRL